MFPLVIPIKSLWWLHTDTPRAAFSRPVHPRCLQWMLWEEKSNCIQHFLKNNHKSCSCNTFCEPPLEVCSPQEHEHVVLSWTRHTQESGRMGDAGQGNLWMVKSPDVSFRLRSLLGKAVGSTSLCMSLTQENTERQHKASRSFTRLSYMLSSLHYNVLFIINSTVAYWHNRVYDIWDFRYSCFKDTTQCKPDVPNLFGLWPLTKKAINDDWWVTHWCININDLKRHWPTL